jgi:HlyD family secretion protein
MRSVEQGQTVASSLSAPTLFIIAEDLRDMEIRALVDESDIGHIREGMTATFTVEAYVDDTFKGVVRQVWLQPETIQNVVNYTVVLDAGNDEGLLFPGMTATVDFLVDEVHDVMLVSSAATRLRPTTSMYAEIREKIMASMTDEERAQVEQRMAAGGGAPGGGAPAGGSSGGFGGAMFGQPEEGTARLWYLEEDGSLAVARVRTGVTDGRSTEIVDGTDVAEGMQVIVFAEEPEEDEGGSNNPLSATFGRRR